MERGERIKGGKEGGKEGEREGAEDGGREGGESNLLFFFQPRHVK